MSTPELSSLLSPAQIGPWQLRNRVFVPGHTTNFGRDNLPTARSAAYHAERARGGVGLIITEAIRVHPTSAGRTISLGSFDDAGIPAYAQMVDAVHAEGALMFAQIMHIGRQANPDTTRTVPWSASDIPWALGAQVPHSMGVREIKVLVDAFGAAARRMAQAGFDGLEIHLGHGHLLQQFLSAATNHRTDAYGGSRDKRLRIVREVLDSVQAHTDLPFGIRISVNEWLDGGIDPDEAVEIVAALAPDYPLQFIHASHSAYHGSNSLATQMADMSFQQSHFIEHAGVIKRAFPEIPVLAVCRLDTLDEAARIINAGEADLAGLARAHIADPHLVNKAHRGERQRRCIACNQECIARVGRDVPIGCVVNPEVGSEAQWERSWVDIAQSPTRRRVLVVGGGPGGMQAAIAAHRAGHDVTLMDREDQLGGRIKDARVMRNRERFGLLIDDLISDVTEAGITTKLNHEVATDEILDGGWDDVILATGSRVRRRPLGSGESHATVLTPLDAATMVREGQVPSGGTAVVFDEDGGWQAASIAETLAASGMKVHLVVPTTALFNTISIYTRLSLLPRIKELGIPTHVMRTLEITSAASVTLHSTMNEDPIVINDVTFVIDVATPRAEDALYRALETHPDAPRIHLVGDAQAPRTAAEATFEGRVAGAFLDVSAATIGALIP